MQYIRATPNDGETFQTLSERLELDYFRGCGYYKLIKSEKISASKDLVLKIANDSWVAGGEVVRSKLGWAAGAVTAKPAMLPSGYELFVQSTSPNRKLPSGHEAVFRVTAGPPLTGTVSVFPHGSEVSASKPNKRKAKDSPKTGPKRRKKGDDSDDDDDDGDGGRDGGANNASSVVVWPRLMFDLNEEVDCLDAEDLVVGASDSGVPGDCDLPVPTHMVQTAIEKVHNDGIRAVANWNRTERLIVPVPPSQWSGERSPHVRYQWRSGTARLMYVDSENATFVALEIPNQNWGLVCGNCGAHPFVHSPHFSYANSDGSSSDMALHQNMITPETVLAKLIHDTALHCMNEEH